jgi:hypothetical protein
MRSTLSIDDSTDAKLRELAEREHLSYKEAVNLVLRQGLDALSVAEAPVTYRVKGFPAGLLPGIDAAKLNQLADDPDL